MIVRWRLLLLVVVTTVMMARAQDSSPSNALSAKRGPVGFQGMRGKKDLTSLEHDEFSKRSPMGFQGMRGKKASITAPVENQLVPKELSLVNNRRASMDKKDNLMPGMEDSYLSGDEYEKSFPPMAFQSIRGKKAPSVDEYYKRAPMGFQGMRGKKSVEEILDGIEKRATMGLQGAKGAMGKDTYSFDYSQDYRGRNERDRNEEILRELEKRAPMGFQGMRGKKAILDAIEALEKRAIMGFHGMRGKKDTFDNYVDYSIDPSDYEKGGTDFQDPEGNELFKRSRIGFHGMRGKREAAQPYGSNIARATISGYQGAAKRQNQLTAYEIGKRSPFRYLAARGKKNPRWEFRGKFVGVRDTFGGGKYCCFHCNQHQQPTTATDQCIRPAFSPKHVLN